jgi:hypothetical protein
MIEIVLYGAQYQKDVEAMVAQINLEFAESIFAPAKNRLPTPDAYWVALSGDEVVGTVAVMLSANQTCILKKMMLKKTYRGKELGISTRLLHTALDWSKSPKSDCLQVLSIIR